MYDKSDLEIRDSRILIKEWDKTKTHFNWKTLIEVQYGNSNERAIVLRIALDSLIKR